MSVAKRKRGFQRMADLFLFKVELAFNLSGRSGAVLAPGIPYAADLPAIGVGAKICLVSPTGERIDTHIAGVEMLNYGARPRPEQIFVPIALPSGISKEQVVPGTDVYLVQA